MKPYDPYDSINRRKKRGILYYVIWYLIAVAILIVAMVIKGQFSWHGVISTVIFMLVMAVVWYFMDKFILKQEEAALKRMEEQFGSTTHGYPSYEAPPESEVEEEKGQNG